MSPNERLQRQFHPWTSYFIVPCLPSPTPASCQRRLSSPRATFADHARHRGRLGHRQTHRGYRVDLGSAKVSRGRIRPPVGWAGLTGGGTIAGVGFTVSLLISDLAFRGQQLEEAKLGVLIASVVASIATFLVLRLTLLLPEARRVRALEGTQESIIDLVVPPDPRRDHIRGPEDSPVTIVEYGDFECPYCGRAEPILRSTIERLRRHPVRLATSAAHRRAPARTNGVRGERGGRKPRRLLANARPIARTSRRASTLMTCSLTRERSGSTSNGFPPRFRHHEGAAHIAEDVDGADLSGVTGTPTFFVNGLRHYGTFDIDVLANAVRVARERNLTPSTTVIQESMQFRAP